MRIYESCKPLEMNDIVIQPIEDRDTYKYLGQDENINFDGPINKERVTEGYFTRVRKIWTSELSAYKVKPIIPLHSLY